MRLSNSLYDRSRCLLCFGDSTANPKYGDYHPSLAFLDEHRGLMPWNELNYIMFLRCIRYIGPLIHTIFAFYSSCNSFVMDYHWAVLNRQSPVDWKKRGEDDKKNLTLLWRQETSQKLEESVLSDLYSAPFIYKGFIALGTLCSTSSRIPSMSRCWSLAQLELSTHSYRN